MADNSNLNQLDQNSSSSMSHSTIDDISNPYYLHHSDSLGLVLVSQQLTGKNYASWNHAMTITLSVKNKLGFIDGLVTRPKVTPIFSIPGSVTIILLYLGSFTPYRRRFQPV